MDQKTENSSSSHIQESIPSAGAREEPPQDDSEDEDGLFLTYGSMRGLPEDHEEDDGNEASEEPFDCDGEVWEGLFKQLHSLRSMRDYALEVYDERTAFPQRMRENKKAVQRRLTATATRRYTLNEPLVDDDIKDARQAVSHPIKDGSFKVSRVGIGRLKCGAVHKHTGHNVSVELCDLDRDIAQRELEWHVTRTLHIHKFCAEAQDVVAFTSERLSRTFRALVLVTPAHQGTLDEEKGPNGFTLTSALRAMTELLWHLADLHTCGIAHLGISPKSILCDDGHFYLGGLSHVVPVGSELKEGIRGSLQKYYHPDLWAQNLKAPTSVTHLDDFHALGMVLWEDLLCLGDIVSWPHLSRKGSKPKFSRPEFRLKVLSFFPEEFTETVARLLSLLDKIFAPSYNGPDDAMAPRRLASEFEELTRTLLPSFSFVHSPPQWDTLQLPLVTSETFGNAQVAAVEQKGTGQGGDQEGPEPCSSEQLAWDCRVDEVIGAAVAEVMEALRDQPKQLQMAVRQLQAEKLASQGNPRYPIEKAVQCVMDHFEIRTKESCEQPAASSSVEEPEASEDFGVFVFSADLSPESAKQVKGSQTFGHIDFILPRPQWSHPAEPQLLSSTEVEMAIASCPFHGWFVPVFKAKDAHPVTYFVAKDVASALGMRVPNKVAKQEQQLPLDYGRQASSGLWREVIDGLLTRGRSSRSRQECTKCISFSVLIDLLKKPSS